MPHPKHEPQPSQLPPSKILTEFVVSLLTPFLLNASLTDPADAARAARETIAAYKAASAEQLVSIAQLVAFALTAVDNLRLSLPANLGVTTKLRLRGNANALNRSASRTAATLKSQRGTRPEPPAPKISPTQPPAPAHTPTPATDHAWANAMTNVAAEFTAELASLPAAQQRIQHARIGALASVARQLTSGTAPPLKARLLSSTALLTPAPS